MFTIRAIELRNWDFWRHFSLPLNESIVMLTGPNGSGKTTILDAIRVILNTRLSNGRKVGKYVRDKNKTVVIKAVVTNTPIKGRRPFASISIRTDEATLACVLTFKGGAPDKHFLVLSGNADMEKIEKAFRENEFYGSEAYSDILNKAGVSKSLLNILTLEQGDTNKLCSKTPQELFSYVMEIKGNQIVLDQYKNAKINYRKALEELREQQGILVSEQETLNRLQREKLEYETYESHLNEKNQLENETLPLAVYKEKRAELEKIETEIKTQRGQIDTLRKNIEEINREVSSLQQETESIEEKIRRMDTRKSDFYDEKSKLDTQVGETRSEKKKLEETKIEVEKIQPKDIGKLEKESQELQKTLTRLNIEKEKQENIVSEHKAELEDLRRGINPYKSYVREFSNKLKEVDISHILLADAIEIVDEKWRCAIESLLGWDRFTIIVDSDYSIKAREIGQRFKYRHYISEAREIVLPSPNPGSALEKVHFLTDKIPLWIAEILNNTALVNTIEEGYKNLAAFSATITPDAYMQNAKGGIFVEIKDYYCGQGGRKERIKTTEKGLIDEQETLKEIERETKSLTEKISNVESEINQQNVLIHWNESEKKRYQELLETLIGLEKKSTEYLAKIINIKQKLEKERILEKDIREKLTKRKLNLGSFESTLNGTNKSLLDNIQKSKTFDIEIKDLENKLPPGNLQPEILINIPPSGSVEHSIKTTKEKIEKHQGCKDLTILVRYANQDTNVKKQEVFVEKRHKEVEEGKEELKKCRSDYIKVVKQVIWNYRTNASKLAKMAKAEIKIEAPNLSEEDDSIDHTGLEIDISFDEKAFTPIGDSDLSGGQQVIASLILLMSLADLDEDTSGFFILDEPFAHLSIERIDEVTRFLQASKAQYILTTPSTHNVNIYTPAGLIFTLFKKKQGEIYAPLPAICRGK